jgi:mitogen-activated protein kinase organizer 1
MLVSTTEDSVRLFDKSTGELLQEYEGHKNQKYRIDSVLNDSDQLVLSGSENGFVYVWDLVEGNMVNMLRHSEETEEEEAQPSVALPSSMTVHSLSFHPKKNHLLTAARGKVYMWREPGEEDEEEEAQ